MSSTTLWPLPKLIHVVIALYRALLSQCAATPLEKAKQDDLQNIVRNRFHVNRHLRSPRRLKLSFYAGYKALDHLDGAVAGQDASTRKIATYLSEVPASLREPRKLEVAPPPHEDPPYVTPPEHQFFNVFPRAEVEGVRKVPFIVRANGFPMVRWKKPQPPRLSRTLRQLILQKQRSIDYMAVVENYFIPVGQHEDEWDKVLRQEFKLKKEDAITWASAAEDTQVWLKELSSKRYHETLERAHRMISVVEKEQELADKEREERQKAEIGGKLLK